MKMPRLPRPLRNDSEATPHPRRSLPILAGAALMAGCALSTAPGKETPEAPLAGGAPPTYLPYEPELTGTGGSPFLATGGTGTGGTVEEPLAGEPPPPFVEMGGANGVVSRPDGLGGATNEAEEETGTQPTVTTGGF